MKRTGVLLVFLAGVLAITLGSAEVYHRFKFGHFVGYGLHTDVILGNSDVGSNDTYYARLWNFSATPLELGGCVEASDVGGRPDSVYYRWDIQKRDSANQRWVSLHGADTWEPTPFRVSWDDDSPCRPAMTRLQPLRSLKVAWVYKDWVTTGDPIRIAIHSSATKPSGAQRIIYTRTFLVKPPTLSAK